MLFWKVDSVYQVCVCLPANNQYLNLNYENLNKRIENDKFNRKPFGTYMSDMWCVSI